LAPDEDDQADVSESLFDVMGNSTSPDVIASTDGDAIGYDTVNDTVATSLVNQSTIATQSDVYPMGPVTASTLSNATIGGLTELAPLASSEMAEALGVSDEIQPPAASAAFSNPDVDMTLSEGTAALDMASPAVARVARMVIENDVASRVAPSPSMQAAIAGNERMPVLVRSGYPAGLLPPKHSTEGGGTASALVNASGSVEIPIAAFPGHAFLSSRTTRSHAPSKAGKFRLSPENGWAKPPHSVDPLAARRSRRHSWRVDSAIYRSSTDDNLQKDVTDEVNELIALNGVANITGGVALSPLFGNLSSQTQMVLRVAKGVEKLRIPESSDVLSSHLFDLRPVFGEPLQIDEAIYTSIDDSNASKDVTKTVNQLIAMYGIGNFTGASGLNFRFGDVAPNAPKMLNVRRGDDILHLRESSSGGPTDKVFDLRPLFEDPLHVDDVLFVKPNRFSVLRTQATKLSHVGADCWKACGDRGGYCAWCGIGNACCKKDWEWSPTECRGVTSFLTSGHECVRPVIAPDPVEFLGGRTTIAARQSEATASAKKILNASTSMRRMAKKARTAAETHKSHLKQKTAKMPSTPLFVAVFSQRGSVERRNMVRGMHQRATLLGMAMTKFAICSKGLDKLHDTLLEEAVRHSDIMLLNCTESHTASRLGRKLSAALVAFLGMPKSTDLFLKIDDDTFVAWAKLAEFVNKWTNPNLYIDLSVSNPSSLPGGGKMRPGSMPWFPTAFMLGRNLVASIVHGGFAGPFKNGADSSPPVGAWIKAVAASGTTVNVMALPCNSSRINGLTAGAFRLSTSSLSASTWSSYPHLVQTGLDGRTISCLFSADAAGDPSRPIGDCLSYEPDGGDSALDCNP